MARLYDMARVTVSGAPGTGTITLGAAVSGYQTFSAAGALAGDEVSYNLTDYDASHNPIAWEVGRGIYNGTTLTRGPLFSSNGGAAISASSLAEVWLTPLTEDFRWQIAGNTAGVATSGLLPDIQFIGGANITLAGSSNSLTISGTAVGGGTSSLYAVGNTTGDTSSESVASSLSFDGAGLVSIGFSGGSIVISATSGSTSQSAPTLSLYAVGNTTTSTSSGVIGAGSLSFDGAGIVSIGVSGSSVVVSATSASQTVQTLGLFAVGNTTGATSSETADARTLSVDGAGIVSVGFSNGSLIVSATAGGGASGTSENVFALGNTTAATSSTTLILTNYSISGAGGASVGFSTTGAGAGVIVISGATTAAQTVPTLSLFAVGNTTTSTSSGVIGAGSISFDGAGIVSVGISGSSVVISAPTPAASQGGLSWNAVGNTTGVTSSSASSVPETLTISGAGGVSVGFSSSTIVISGATTVASGTVKNLVALGNTTAATSSTTETLTNISFSGAGGVSVGFSTTAAGSGVVVISGATTAAQTAPTLSLFAVGNTTTSTSSGVIAAGSLSFDGAGIVSVGISGSSVVISAPSPAASQGGLSWNAIGNTTGVTSSSASSIPETLTLSGAGGVSVGFSSSTIVISGATTVASGTTKNVFALGNTTAATSSTTETLTNYSFSGAGGVSIGFSTTGAGAGVIVVSGATTAASSGGLSFNAIGNTTGVTSSSASSIPETLTISGAGGVSVGFSSSTIVISGATTAASGTAENMAALGNTTGATSSSVLTLSAMSVSGAGAVSVGFSTTGVNAGVLVISGATVAAGAQSIFALGNTTGVTSSQAAGAGSISISGAGGVSVGMSSTTLVISGQVSATSMGLSATGNTTGATSSMSQAITAATISGAGGASVGFSSSTAIISAPNTSSLVGTNGVVLSTNAATISISLSNFGYIEPQEWNNSTTTTQPLGTMFLAPMSVPGLLSVNQANFMSSRAVAAPIVTASSSTASRTVTASGTWGSTASLVVYSQADATNFSTFVSSTAFFGMSVLYSASFSSSSKTISQTVSFAWPQGTSTQVTSSMSSTFSTVSASFTTNGMHTSSSLFSGWLRNDYPFAATLIPGAYLAGIMWSTASGTSTLSTGLITVSAPTWLATLGVISYPAITIGVPGAALSTPFPGVGSTSSAGSAVPAGVSWQNLSTVASYLRPYFYMIQGSNQ